MDGCAERAYVLLYYSISDASGDSLTGFRGQTERFKPQWLRVISTRELVRSLEAGRGLGG